MGSSRNYSTTFVDGLERRIKRLERDVLSIERSLRKNEIALQRLTDIIGNAMEPEIVEEKEIVIPSVVSSTPVNINSRHVVLEGRRLETGMVIQLRGQNEPYENGFYTVGHDDRLVRVGDL